jgi:hypothetical protein
VRISDQLVTIAIKGAHHGLARAEYEYEIPLADAEAILSKVCPEGTLKKQRYFVEHAGAIWHADVYGGVLQGIVIAEIELEQEGQEVVLPTWIGKEIRRSTWWRRVVPPALNPGPSHLRPRTPVLGRGAGPQGERLRQMVVTEDGGCFGPTRAAIN